MPVKVLIVDDSGFFRKRIADLVSGDPRLTVVGTAENGREAIEKVHSLRPDVITMDIEMPEMNGIEALRVIMRERPTPVMMLSSLTHEGAGITIRALEAGAADYLQKDIREWMGSGDNLGAQVREKLIALSQSRAFSRPVSAPSVPPAGITGQRSRTAPVPARSAPAVGARSAGISGAETAPAPGYRAASPSSIGRFPDCRIVVIGSSTGGPAALQSILTKLPAGFPYPLLLVQHMPKTFTAVFAERLNQQCQIAVKEAEDGDMLKPGQALLAPGGHQLIIDPRFNDRVRILPADDRITYKPSVDITYGSASKCFGGKVLAVILTGMGADGTEGARVLKRQGATIWAQDENSSTIFGMPKAVIEAGLADAVLDLNQIGDLLGKQGRR